MTGHLSTAFSTRFHRMAIHVIAAWICVLGTNSSDAADWTRYRGPNGTGVSALKGIPTNWSPGDYIFNVKLPGEGHGAAVVRGNRLFVTAAIDRGATR